jgi:AraC-like DNA-binding protein
MSTHWHVRLFTANTTSIGISSNPWNHPELREPFWRLYCNDNDGAQLIPPKGEPLLLQSGRIYILPSGVSCRSLATKEAGHFHVHFDVLGVPHRVIQEFFARPLAVPESEILKAKMRDLWGIHHTGRDLPESKRLAVELCLTSLVYDALAQVISAFAPPSENLCLHRDLQQEAVQPALDYITHHLAERIAISQLASLCCLSEDYFIRRFRQAMGITPTQYIQKQRVNAAAQYLAFSDATIESIVQQTGFGSRYYFTRIFKRYTGRSPGSYRKMPPA